MSFYDIASMWPFAQMVFAGYMAIALVGTAIGMICWYWFRNKFYLYFSFYIFCSILMSFFGGFATGFKNITEAELNLLSYTILFAMLTNVSFFLFTRALVEPHKKMPRLYSALLTSGAVLVGLDIIAFFNTNEITWQLRGLALLIFTVVNLVIQFRSIRENSYIRWYAWGILTFLVLITPMALFNAGIIRSFNVITASSPFLGVFLQVFLFLIGLIEQLKHEYESKLKDANLKLLGNTAAEIFHEAATPVSMILYHAMKLNELAQNTIESSLAGDLKEKAFQIEGQCNRIIANMNRFKTLSGYKKTIQNEIINLDELLNSVADVTSLKLQKNQQTLFVDNNIDKNITIYGNKFELEQILINLIMNASDAIKDLNEKWIKITTDLVDKNIEINITDSGKGIAKELREKIFEAFFTTKQKNEGTGLGLHICRKFAENNNGELYLDESNANTNFILKLPYSSVSDIQFDLS